MSQADRRRSEGIGVAITGRRLQPLTCRDQATSQRRARSTWIRAASARMMGRVDLKLLVTPDCPHEQPTAVLLRTALDDVGLTKVGFATTVVFTTEDAQRLGFTGSPTILVNGQDPFAVPGALPALACRIYPGPDGPTGMPPLRELRQALKRAAAAVP